MNDNTANKRTPFILGAFLVSGACALIYEVIWTRALSLVLGSTVYALSTMLSTFMAGLAIGSYLGGKLSDRGKNLLAYFALCELGIGITGLASIPLIYKLPRLYLAIYRNFHLYPTVFFTIQVLLCAAVMLVPTILMGATFPLVSRRITENLNEMGRKVGDAYSLNTVGAVAGSLAVGFYLIPTYGIRGATLFAGVLNLLVAGSMLLVAGKGVRKPLMAALPIFIMAAAWEATAREETLFLNFYGFNEGVGGKTTAEIVENDRIWQQFQVFSGEYAEGAVRAFKGGDGSFVLQVGGKVEGTGRRDIANTLLLAYLPIAYHPGPRNFLTIGLGAGLTLSAAKEHIADLHLVEINPGVVDAVARHGQPGLLDNVRVIVNDARNYLMRTDVKYDIISSEPSYPTESSVASLFTRDFYEIAASRLTPDGIYSQWLPAYLLNKADLVMMVKTFATVFPQTTLWKVESSNDLIMVGGRSLRSYPAEEILKKVQRLSMSGFPVNCTLIGTPEQAAEIVRRPDIPVNSDDRPLLEFHAVNTILTRENASRHK